jgi:hypothetical protein
MGPSCGSHLLEWSPMLRCKSRKPENKFFAENLTKVQEGDDPVHIVRGGEEGLRCEKRLFHRGKHKALSHLYLFAWTWE